jgi:hypothetical protein
MDDEEVTDTSTFQNLVMSDAEVELMTPLEE